MPNTLCHIALQAPLSGLFIPRRLLLWALLGCIIPDLPWVTLKLLLFLDFFNPYDLRLYFTAQASLIFSLLLAASLALFMRHSLKIGVITGANCILHLLLDALQIKWGNGVNLLAPFDWHLLRVDLLWPEHFLITISTLFGLIYLIAMWHPIRNGYCNTTSFYDFSNRIKTCVGFLLLLFYCLAPFLCFDAMHRSDTYYINTMRQKDKRVGKIIAFDRAHYRADTKEIQIYTGETIKMVGTLPPKSGRVSFRGTFTGHDTVRSNSYHHHHNFRDWASTIGLFLTCTLLLQSLVLPGKTHQQP